ncbi:MAG TPA: OmpA family protein [Saprospiraceae bacterium]|nr:OmpA family protein [Saprospiraceae bacterium]HMP23821.1 OmpA family protein [Saprospiraceae bacterium]
MRALVVFLFFCGYALFARWYYVCEIKQRCDPAPPAPADIRLRTLRLMSKDTVLLQGYDQFAFDSTHTRPRLNADNEAFLDTVAGYLRLFPQKKLTITGLYRRGEDSLKVGFYENIGVARAAEVRKLLMQRGIDEQQISLDYERTTDSLLREPLRFNALPDIPDAFDIVQFSFTNMTFSDANFAFNSDKFIPGEPFKLYADSVKTYLALNPEKTLTVIGHTDNVGSDAYNLNLGLRRAKSARTYFEELGVITAIKVASEGKRRPVASNNTDEGRQKNRRVNFVLE